MGTSGIYRNELFDIIIEAIPFLVAEIESGEILFASRPLEAAFGCEMRGGLVGERVESLISERKGINEDIKEILDEAAEKNGFNKKVIRKVIQRRAVARFIRQQEDSMIESYEGVVNTDEDE